MHCDKHCDKTRRRPNYLSLYKMEAVARAAVSVSIACRKVHYQSEQRQNNHKNQKYAVITSFYSDDIRWLNKIVFTRFLSFFLYSGVGVAAVCSDSFGNNSFCIVCFCIRSDCSVRLRGLRRLLSRLGNVRRRGLRSGLNLSFICGAANRFFSCLFPGKIRTPDLIFVF